MNIHNFFKHIIVFALLLTATALHADETQPKFTIIPTTQTKWIIPVNGAARVAYVVTNQTKITRTLTMRPIAGIPQTTTGTGVCGSTFTLAHGQSCQLVFHLVGSQLSGHIVGGPVICKTNGHGDNSPDPFLCSQASRANSLDITSVGVENALITITPSQLILQVNSSMTGTFTFTNTSTTVTALNIGIVPSSYPPTWAAAGITFTSSGCNSVAPGGTCSITFTPGPGPNVPSPSSATLLFQGSNTTQVSGTVIFTKGSGAITVNPNVVTLIVAPFGAPMAVTVTNTSTTVTVDGVHVNLPTGWSDIGVAYNPPSVLPTCPPIPPLGTCTIQFTPGLLVHSPPRSIPILGDNLSNNPTISLAVNSNVATITVTPTSVALGFGNSPASSGVVTVKNTSSSNINATTITTTPVSPNFTSFVSPACALLVPGQSCTITYTATNVGTGSTVETIQGTIPPANTNAVLVTVSVTSGVLSISPCGDPDHCALFLAKQGLFNAASGGGNSDGSTKPSKTRFFVLNNISTTSSTGPISVTYTPVTPTTFTLSTASQTCLNNGIAPGGNCQIQITPTTTPTKTGIGTINPETITFWSPNLNSVTEQIIVLTYTNNYQDGAVFAVDDTTPLGGSVGGSVATYSETETSNSETSKLPWDANCATSGCVIFAGASSISDGVANTATIFAALTTLNGENPSAYAAGVCHTKSLGTNPWYLPAQCQMVASVPTSPPTCLYSTGVLKYQNIYSNANYLLAGNNFLWTSTQTSSAEAIAFTNLPTIISQPAGKTDLLSVMCTSNFPPPTSFS